MNMDKAEMSYGQRGVRRVPICHADVECQKLTPRQTTTLYASFAIDPRHAGEDVIAAHGVFVVQGRPEVVS